MAVWKGFPMSCLLLALMCVAFSAASVGATIQVGSQWGAHPRLGWATTDSVQNFEEKVRSQHLLGTDEGYLLRSPSDRQTAIAAAAQIGLRQLTLSPAAQSLLHQKTTLFREAKANAGQLRDPSPPSFTCDVCNDLGESIWNAVKDGGKSLQEIEAIVNGTCQLVLGKDPTLAKLCTDVFVDVLVILHKKAPGISWNLTEIVCYDALKLCFAPCCVTETLPEQVHLSFTGGDALLESALNVAWVSMRKPAEVLVQWWPTANGTGVMQSAVGQSKTYTVGGWIGWIHTAVMTGLIPDTEYTYTVGSIDGGWSKEYNFRTLPLNAGTEGRPLRVISYADMGVGGDHAETLALVTNMVKSGKIDFILHTGDISYADADQYRWDRFLREMEPITARIPYMTAAGNHELPWNFTVYKNRFVMPPTGYGAPADAMYYTFSVGPFRFIHLDSETWWDTPRMDAVQLAWASRVMTEANRLNQFIWLGFHRPLYCSCPDGGACKVDSEFLRERVEPLTSQHRVAVVHTGHVHNYERMYPVMNLTVSAFNYSNPTDPVPLVNGAPGCIEGLSRFAREKPEWSAKRIKSAGFLVTEFYQSSSDSKWFTMKTSFLSSQNGTVLDSMTLTKRV